MNRILLLLFVFGLFCRPGRPEGIYSSPVIYPAAGNIRAEAGTIEFWFRLDTSAMVGCYFGLFRLVYPSEPSSILDFSYNDHLGTVVFRVAGAGKLYGVPVGSTYLSSALFGMQLKTSQPYPRHRSLDAREWHYTALCWEGPWPEKFHVYLDGKLIIPAGKMRGLVWHDLKQGRIQGPYGVLTVDELRISSICRTKEEISRYYETVEKSDGAPTLEVPEEEGNQEEFLAELEGMPEPGFAQDEYTLLLDHFTHFDSDGITATTLAAQVSGFSGERGGNIHPTAWKRVKGKFGSALQLWE